jgi:enoyl reductase
MIRKMLTTVAVLAVAVTGTPTPASADFTPGVHGNARGGTLRGKVKLSGDTGGGAPIEGGMPPCWYSPGETGPELYKLIHGSASAPSASGADRGNEAGGDDPEVDKHKKDKGKWWFPDGIDGPEGTACAAALKLRVWVPEGDPPPPQHVTAGQLAMIARAALLLTPPKTKVNPAPPKRSYVGLATWVWAAPEKKTRQVTASLPELNLSATVTATRGGLQLSPGTGDRTRYELYPPGGMCPGVGDRYTGASQTPPCGVTYQQSSADLPNRVYALTASFTWTVTWAGSDGTGGTMAPGTFAATVNIPVGEVQSINGH